MPSVTIVVSISSGWNTAQSFGWKEKGITWRLKESLEDMEYVDDIP
jgi:hypothetical protein